MFAAALWDGTAALSGPWLRPGTRCSELRRRLSSPGPMGQSEKPNLQLAEAFKAET